MARAGFVGRHRSALASSLALVVATGAVVTYAVSADGYKAHEADLNDGGVWVVNGDLGWTGRINKPINQLDGVVVGEGPDRPLDILQDGAAVIGHDIRSSRLTVIEPGQLEAVEGGAAAVPPGGDVQMGGGTLASLDRGTGDLWAVRYDARLGKPSVTDVDRQADALLEVGGGGALAVSLAGTVVVTSGEEGTVTTLRPAGRGLDEPDEAELPEDAGSPSAVTTVGKRIVTLDATSGALTVLDNGAAADVPAGSKLQQPGPAASSVLVGTPTSLLSVDLRTGDVAAVAERSGGAVEPVRLGACVYGAWSGGDGFVAVQCGADEAKVEGLGGDASELAFRVNRGEIVLNDATSGTVWDVQQAEPREIDNWESFVAKKKDKDEDEEDESQRDSDRRPPQAKPDTYGVRPGRTSVLHPLDNDSAPEGRILSIVGVDSPGNGVRTMVSPDGQTIQVVMPEGARRTVSFDYEVDDGRDQRDRATVTVGVRQPGQNERPAPRQGYEPRRWAVPAGGSVSVPVLSDWRDDADSDALVLDSASAQGGAQTGALARSTADGRIRFTAPPQVAEQTKVRVTYAVTDGQAAAPVRRTLQFLVQPTKDRHKFPPVAEPDVVRGEVGRPIEIRPLANDLPGSDPATPHAELVMGARIPGQPHARIVTDLDKGVVTFTADRAGTYFLDYDAAYGYAPLSGSTIRVDVHSRPDQPADPVAMPDTVMLYGNAPALVDVLANDLDPSGDLLVVQRAVAESEGQVDVAIVNGRWLRFSVRDRLAPPTQIVRYTVTNGRASARGEVTITQREEPVDNTPVTVTDRVVVRAGAAVSAPVLDNDVSPSGDRLSLSAGVTDRVGELDVVEPLDYEGTPGHAFVSGRVVRFVAPVGITERETFQVRYAAVGAGGATAPGRLVVSVIPTGARNTAPRPPTLEGRAVAGDVVTVRLPGSDVDPEGDPVAVTGITSAPKLGRLLSYTANALRYQAYVGSVGTDEFSYAVVDTNGAVATGTARVAVVPPADPQPPLAVDDELTVQPGRTATFDPMANDHAGAGVDAQLELVEPGPGVLLDPDTGLVTVQAPDSLAEPAIQVVYSLSNGIDESRATMTLRTAPDVENPPVVHDAYGNADDSQRVAVDVLEGAYDPDGDADDIEVVDVFAEEDTATHTADSVSVDRHASPRVIPFRVEDGQGTSALAQVFVPPSGRQIPYVRPGAVIELDEGGRKTGSLKDYIVSPSGGQLRLTSRQGVHASPEQLSATAADTGSFEVRAGPGFSGAGAVLVEVTTAVDRSGNEDATDASDGYTALLSIPVQVGDDTPELDCPGTPIPISASEEKRIDIQSLCQVFTLDPRDAPRLDYSASWEEAVDGVDLSRSGGSVFLVRADRAADGGVARLSVRAGDSNTEVLSFRVVEAPEPRMSPIKVPDVKAGESRTVDLAPYLVPGVSDPSPRVLSIKQIGGARSQATHAGSSVTLSPDLGVQGRVEYRVVMTDVAESDPPASRTAVGRLAFEVRGVPGATSEPFPYPNERTGEIRVGWFPPKDTGGSPIQHYQLVELRTGDKQICKQTECFFRGLEPNRNYTFKVRAQNAVGYGPWSGESRQAFVDTRPGRVRNVRMVARGDGSISLAWDRPTLTASKIITYFISWPGGGTVEVPGDQERVKIDGLDNNTEYVFSIVGENKVGLSDPRESPVMQPLGTPAPPLNVAATDLNTGLESTTVQVSWSATAPEGPGDTLYTVYLGRDGATPRTVPGCDKIRATTCNDRREYDGSSYAYFVRAQNQPRPEPPNISSLSAPAVFDAVGKPAAWGSWSWTPTGNSGEVQLSYTVPDPRGDTSRVEIWVDGAVARSFPSQRGSVVTRVQVGSNEVSHTVALRVCNEKALCTTSTSQAVQSYGPLAVSLNDITWDVYGKRIIWHLSGTSNGDPAVLTYRVGGGATQTVRLAGVGAFSHDVEHVTEGYRQDVRIDAVLSDDAPGNRGSTHRSSTARSGEPPDPTVLVRPGASCQDGVQNPEVPDCRRGAADATRVCDVASCKRVRLHLIGWENWTHQRVGCAVTIQRSGWFAGEVDWLRQEDTPADVGWYSPGGDVQVTCTGGGKTASGIWGW